MSQSLVPPTTVAERDALPVEEAPRATEGGPGGPTAPPLRAEIAARPSGWTGGRIAALVVGALLLLFSLALLGGGGTALWADRTQRDGGYVTTDDHHFSTSGSALTTKPTDLGSAGVGWLYSPDVLGRVRIRVTPTNTDRATFVGIGPSADVDRYLAGVDRTVISEFFGDKVEPVGGGTPASAPASQDFWVASATGNGPQEVAWNPADGSWTVVVMNPDGRPGISVGADLGAKMPALPWIALGVLGAGVLLMTGGGLLIAGALTRGRTPPLQDKEETCLPQASLRPPRGQSRVGNKRSIAIKR